jgi:hypothetical protein
MFSQDVNTTIEMLCNVELHIKIVEHVDADDPRDPEDEQE